LLLQLEARISLSSGARVSRWLVRASLALYRRRTADYACTIPPCGVSLGDGRRESSMVEKRLDRSRREVIRAVVTGVPAGLLLRVSPTEASEKMTRQQAEYRDAPKDIYSCGMCTLFEPPKYCKVVEGEVSKDGWCKAFVLAD
jgi:hypothetical protein